ncbi:hypothetical protein WJX81_001427 [Elliptochloris bilobata]|uniref:Uncharacterized protein n=1 Tax=Elliptochloris bilobata TaxID=381761 RepID=A0AAW1SJ16_9CHLO
MWAPVLSCAFFAALKVFEGQTGDLLHVCQDKVLVMVISNYILWPLANALNAHLVPEEHRKIAGHIITIIWNAWLSALLSQAAVLGGPAALAGHAGQAAAAAAAAAAVGHSATESVLASMDAMDVAQVSIPDSPFVHVSEAVGDFTAPLLNNVTAALEGAAALAHKLPGNLIEKAFSRSLDLINPLREFERTPSQRTATRILQRSDTATFLTCHLSSAATEAGSGIGVALAS